MNTPKHTPLPWQAARQVYRLDNEGRDFIGIGNGAEHIGYASITACVPLAEAKANAAYIVQACNAYPKLVSLLERLVANHSVEYSAYNNLRHEARHLLKDL